MSAIHDVDPNDADDSPCACGGLSFNVSATIIVCRWCGRTWGRVNGLWMFDTDTEPRDGFKQIEGKQ